VKTLLVACASIACATPSATVDGHRVLTGIEVVGNASLSSDDLKGKIVTRPTTGVFSKDVRYYDPEVFEVDLQRIVRWYNAKGFYRARVTNVEKGLDDEGRVKLVVHIDEGNRARVQSVEFEGASALSDKERADLHDALPFHVGDPFDEDQYEKSKVALADQLRESGYGRAVVSGLVRVEPESGIARIVYRLDPGQRLRFGTVRVTGNQAISSERIADAAAIEPGTPFRPTVLSLAEKRVYQLGVFSGARVTVDPLAVGADAPVNVRVREAPFRTLRLGLGAEIDDMRWEVPRLRAEYTDRNLGGRLLRLELISTLGLAFVPNVSAAVAGEPNTKAGITTFDSAQLTVPRLWRGFDFAVRGEFARELQSGFAYDEVAARVSLGWHHGYHAIVPSLNFVRYFDASVDLDLQSLINQGNQNIAILASSNCIPTCTLTYPEIRYSYDSRDNVFEPRQGFLVTVDLRQTLKPGSFTYFRFEPEVRAYFALSRHVVFGARAQFGALILEGQNQGAQAAPFPQRFFGGGQTYQRGYAPQQQGPKVGSSIQDGRFTNWLATGGNGALLLSAEVRWRTDFWLEHTELVLFADASRITSDPAPPWKGPPLEIAPGLGLGYLTPFGAIRFDAAYTLNPTIVTLASVTSKAPDGSTVVVPDTIVAPACSPYPNTPCLFQRRWAFHLTLGESF